MEWLNYHHLLYFWSSPRKAASSRPARSCASRTPTISGQIHGSRTVLGQKLFDKHGRNLV